MTHHIYLKESMYNPRLHEAKRLNLITEALSQLNFAQFFIFSSSLFQILFPIFLPPTPLGWTCPGIALRCDRCPVPGRFGAGLHPLRQAREQQVLIERERRPEEKYRSRCGRL